MYICARCTRDVPRKKEVEPETVYCSPGCRKGAEKDKRPRKTTRSKIELYIESRFHEDNPKLKVLFNSKTAIGLELDLYFPEHNVAVELNGVFHYQPIFGGRSLYRTQRNDSRKRERCKRKGIYLFVIDISQIKRFTDEVNEELYQIILCQLGL
jgi:hypothetical protein